jgi:hypothetical protein
MPLLSTMRGYTHTEAGGQRVLPWLSELPGVRCSSFTEVGTGFVSATSGGAGSAKALAANGVRDFSEFPSNRRRVIQPNA